MHLNYLMKGDMRMHRSLKLSLICVLCTCLLTACGDQRGELVTSQPYDTEMVDDTEVSYSQGDTSVIIQEEQVAVYVCGAVAEPGVYYLPADSIKQDALDAAGGFIEGAVTTYVNLAEKVSDGEQIYFPFVDELSDSYSPLGERNDGKININQATVEELMTLPGIGENKAKAIITYREEYGAFQTIEDITNIPGIKEGIYDNIKDYIVVD